ncbi:MAG: hypothetical protein ACFFDN_24920 [Candidatus Hodarchaeota archaeon]
MGQHKKFVTLDELIPNFADLPRELQIEAGEEQYRKQMIKGIILGNETLDDIVESQIAEKKEGK